MAQKVEICAGDNAQTPLFPTAASLDAPGKTIGSFSWIALAATGAAMAVPGTLVGFIISDPGTSGSLRVYDNPSAASGTDTGVIKIATATNYIPCNMKMAAGAWVVLAGSATVVAIFKADP